MWQFLTNIFSESVQSIGVVLLGAEDTHRARKKAMNSAERFVKWGKESNSTLEYQESLVLLKKLSKSSENFDDELRYNTLLALTYAGLIHCKVNEMNKFNKKINKKYDTDNYMNDAIYRISNRMKELQAIISAAETADIEQLKLLLGDQKVHQTRTEELALDARKEYEKVEDDFIMKSSVKENKGTEIKNFKTIIITEVDELQEQIKSLNLSFDANAESHSETEKLGVEQFKEQVNTELKLAIDKLNKAGISVKKI